MASMLNAMMRQ